MALVSTLHISLTNDGQPKFLGKEPGIPTGYINYAYTLPRELQGMFMYYVDVHVHVHVN